MDVPWWLWILIILALGQILKNSVQVLRNRYGDPDTGQDPGPPFPPPDGPPAISSGLMSMLQGEIVTVYDQYGRAHYAKNPYKMIMMYCPTTQKPVKTGINSAYFEEWHGNPPPDSASFVCPECDQTHHFGKEGTWLEELY